MNFIGPPYGFSLLGVVLWGRYIGSIPWRFNPFLREANDEPSDGNLD